MAFPPRNLTFMLLAFLAQESIATICTSSSRTFTAKVDLYASELGYYKFDECGDVVNPTLGLEKGVEYTFDQTDISNWMHPLGLAYFPDGAHADKDELEPTISQSGSTTCASDFSCPTPLYYLNDNFLGVNGTEDFGLDVYEPMFFHNPAEWTGHGSFSLKLTFNDDNYNNDIFYFCHIHELMSGRIKFVDSEGKALNEADEPAIDYEYDVPGEFDQMCGTFGLDAFQLPHAMCPSQFVCTSEEDSVELTDYASCIDAMNCHMLAGMTTGVRSQDEVALFIHQMIPHHQNAVNMAKNLLKTNKLNCADLTNEDDPDCIMEVILREIVNGQNHQIQKMRSILESKNLPQSDNCDVLLETKGVKLAQEEIDVKGADETTTSGSISHNVVLASLGAVMPIFGFYFSA